MQNCAVSKVNDMKCVCCASWKYSTCAQSLKERYLQAQAATHLHHGQCSGRSPDHFLESTREQFHQLKSQVHQSLLPPNQIQEQNLVSPTPWALLWGLWLVLTWSTYKDAWKAAWWSTHHPCGTSHVAGNHLEHLSFQLMSVPQLPVIPGHPWLVKHNHHMDGPLELFWVGVVSVILPALNLPSPASFYTSSPEFPDLSGVPPDYLDLEKVFNKSWATSLPPYRTYDCTIDLLRGRRCLKGICIHSPN